MHVDPSPRALRRLVADIGELHIDDVEAIYGALSPEERQQIGPLFGEILGDRLGANLDAAAVTTTPSPNFDQAMLRRAIDLHPTWLQHRALAHLAPYERHAIRAEAGTTRQDAQRDHAFSTTPTTCQALREIILALATAEAPHAAEQVQPPGHGWLALMKKIWSRT